MTLLDLLRSLFSGPMIPFWSAVVPAFISWMTARHVAKNEISKTNVEWENKFKQLKMEWKNKDVSSFNEAFENMLSSLSAHESNLYLDYISTEDRIAGRQKAMYWIDIARSRAKGDMAVYLDKLHDTFVFTSNIESELSAVLEAKRRQDQANSYV